MTYHTSCVKFTWIRSLSTSMKGRHSSTIFLTSFLHTVVDALHVQPMVGLAPPKPILVSSPFERAGIDTMQILLTDHNVTAFMDYLAK